MGDDASPWTTMSECSLWQQMRDYYARVGLSAWRDGVVPSFITTNMYSCRAVLRIIAGLCADLDRQADSGGAAPLVTILEVGAGSGNFAYWLCRLLLEHPVLRLRAARGLLRTVVTDIDDTTVAAWSELDEWATLLATHTVDFALLDSTVWSGSPIMTRHHAWHIPQGEAGTPEVVVVIANYVIDTLPTDAFSVTGGQLFESQLRLLHDRDSGIARGGAAATSDPADPETTLIHSTLEWRQRPLVDLRARYEAQLRHDSAARALSGILAWYQSFFGGVTAPELASTDSSDNDEDDLADDDDHHHDTAADKDDLAADADDGGSTIDDGQSRGGARRSPSDASTAFFTLPVGGVDLLEGIRRLVVSNSSVKADMSRGERSRGSACKVVAIINDKGFSNPSSFFALGNPELARHGAFSVMVNFHSLRLWAQSVGGVAVISPRDGADLRTCVLVLPAVAGTVDASLMQSTLTSFDITTEDDDDDDADDDDDDDRVAAGDSDVVEEPDPDNVRDTIARLAHALPCLATALDDVISWLSSDSFFQIVDTVLDRSSSPTFTLPAVIALCQLADWDPDVVASVRPALVQHLPSARADQQMGVVRGLRRMIAFDYPFSRNRDVSFEAGRILLSIGRFNEARTFFERSLRITGDHAATHFNLGLCLAGQCRPIEALEAMRHANALNPSTEAQSWIGRLETEISTPSDDATPGVIRLRSGILHLDPPLSTEADPAGNLTVLVEAEASAASSSSSSERPSRGFAGSRSGDV